MNVRRTNRAKALPRRGRSAALTPLLASAFVLPVSLHAAQSPGIESICSKLLFTGEDDAFVGFGIDTQVFVVEADGRDRLTVSAPTESTIIADTIWDADWMSDGRIVLNDASGGYENNFRIVDVDGFGRRAIPTNAYLVPAPGANKLAAVGFDGIEVYRPNGNLVGSRPGGDSFGLRWASTGDAMAWLESDPVTRSRTLILADDLARNAVVLGELGFDPDFLPAFQWSPDGTAIVWSDGSSISTASADGSNRRVLSASSGRAPSWSPDGQRIAWDDGSSIVVADADGTNASAVTATSGPPSWSSDNTHIAWFDGQELQIVNIDSGSVTVVPTTVDDDRFSLYRSFDFSPDGTRFAWTTDEREIWVSNSDGTDPILAWTDEFDDQEGLGGPLWSPDSSLFASGGESGVIVTSADGSASREIINSDSLFEVSSVSWSPCIFTPLGPRPDNDDFANAEVLFGANAALASGSTFTTNGSTEEATGEAGEPVHLQGSFGQLLRPRVSIWYSWTSEADQVVEVDTVGSEGGTVLAVYTGTSLRELDRVAKSDGRTSSPTRVRFTARSGETYHFAVDGFGPNAEADVQLNLRRPAIDPSECTITGTDGPDVLTGTAGADVICGLGGADEIYAMGGADTIFAGNGDDFVSAGGGNDTVFGGNGKDTLIGGSGNDLIVGGNRADSAFGGRGDDIILGESGADLLLGAAGNDRLFGGMGADRLFGGGDDDLMDGGPYIDTCVSSAGNDTLVNCE